jgi:hypothetical protein
MYLVVVPSSDDGTVAYQLPSHMRVPSALGQVGHRGIRGVFSYERPVHSPTGANRLLKFGSTSIGEGQGIKELLVIAKQALAFTSEW